MRRGNKRLLLFLTSFAGQNNVSLKAAAAAGLRKRCLRAVAHASSASSHNNSTQKYESTIIAKVSLFWECVEPHAATETDRSTFRVVYATGAAPGLSRSHPHKNLS